MVQLALVTSTLLTFSLYTAAIVAGHGYLGFLELAWREPWGGQVVVDLVIALVLFAQWMRRDARAHGLPLWPYLLLTCTAGSIGALAYLLHRALRQMRAPAPA